MKHYHFAGTCSPRLAPRSDAPVRNAHASNESNPTSSLQVLSTYSFAILNCRWLWAPGVIFPGGETLILPSPFRKEIQGCNPRKSFDML